MSVKLHNSGTLRMFLRQHGYRPHSKPGFPSRKQVENTQNETYISWWVKGDPNKPLEELDTIAAIIDVDIENLGFVSMLFKACNPEDMEETRNGR